MKKQSTATRPMHFLPVLIEHDEDGFVVAECPVFEGCYSRGKTVDEALNNVREVIEMLLEEPASQKRLAEFTQGETGIHTIAVQA